MIIIQPRADGTRLDAYNLALAEIVDELRRSLIHLVATQAGVTIITHDIPRAAAVVPHTPAVPSNNGASPKPVRKPARVLGPVSFDGDQDDEDEL
jgi:hypothetical protein